MKKWRVDFEGKTLSDGVGAQRGPRVFYVYASSLSVAAKKFMLSGPEHDRFGISPVTKKDNEYSFSDTRPSGYGSVTRNT